MPRTPRLIVPGLVYHLISRFVDHEWFITDERQRAQYLELFGRAIQKSDWRCIGFGVMSSHTHTSVVAGKQSLASWIRRAHAPFADTVNKERERIGPVFVRGPRAFETAAADVARLVAYIHNNPVRANVVATAASSSWTSHRAYLGLENPPPWLDVQLGLRLCGFDDSHTFDQFVNLHPSDPAREALERDPMGVDESALFHEAVLDRHSRNRDWPSAHAVVEETALELGVSLARIRSRRRSATEQLAREVAVHCASAVGITGVAIAAALELSQSGASLALSRGVERPVVRELSARVERRLLEHTTHTTHA